MPAAIATATMMTTTTIITADARALLRLQAWLSPAFPTGGFAYSHGLEWAVEQGWVHDGATLQDWLTDLLRRGAGRSDAILLRHAHRAPDLDALAAVADLALASQTGRERHLETTGQGNAFTAAAGAWHPAILNDLAARVGDIAYPVAVGALAGEQGIDEDMATAALLQAFTATLISAAVRLVPLGQTTGLAVLAALEPVVLDVTAATRGATLDDIGGACFRSDLAALRHETQYTRLFRT